MERRKRKILLFFLKCVDLKEKRRIKGEKERVKTKIKRRGKKLKVKTNENYFKEGSEVK